MMSRSLLLLVLLIACPGGPQTGLAQEPDPNSPHVQTLKAFVRLLEHPSIDVETNAAMILTDENHEALLRQVVAVRERIAGCDSVDVALDSKTTGRIDFQMGDGVVSVEFEMTDQPPVRIHKIVVAGEQEQSEADNSAATPITWDNLEARLDEFSRLGFEGVVLVTRDGEVVFHKAYGFANREKRILNSLDTVFATGSQPIDFTHVAILQLVDSNKLELDDPITRFFDDVPEDKRGITVRQLMTGASGFPDFHDSPADVDKDHSWIDREEAVRRMLEHDLLFQPGTDHRHSHSAWGMLAAIVEIVSGETYGEFTRKHQFDVVGMPDTGFFGESVSEARIAVGYGERKASEPNSPPHWGRTSWLVMGSGGQVSTLTDLLEWERAVKDGKLLSPESTKLFLEQHQGVAVDGNMYGFEFVHSTDPDSLFMMISNTVDSRDERRRFQAMGRQLQALVAGERGDAELERVDSPFTLGIRMEIGNEGPVVIADVENASAAERDGLRIGDEIVSVNGEALIDDPLSVLGPLLATDETIEFIVDRGGQRRTVSVTPLPRK